MPIAFKAANGREYEAVIGMEVHAELLTRSKMYCRCKSCFGDPPNTNVCPVCLALPGSLPVVNRFAMLLGTRTALALHCNFADKRFAQFARKHYFYPDLPKNYQITMYAYPIATDGFIEIWSGDAARRIGIERVHLEEDTAKLFHEADGTSSIDFNRAGIPLIEIVSKPEIATPEEAKLYLKELRDILRRNGVSDGNMEEGSFRCEANISLRPLGSEKFGVKSEIKNLNSFAAVEKALNCEIERHLVIYGRGEEVRPDTRGWDDAKGDTFHMRYKEKADEYRYFPEPDIPDVYISYKMLTEAKEGVVLSPFEEKQKLMTEYRLDYHTANIIAGREGGAAFFGKACAAGADPVEAMKWMTGEFFAFLNEENLEIGATKIDGANFAEFLGLVAEGVISGPVAKELLREISGTGEKAESLVERKGLKQVSDSAQLETVVEEVLKENPENVKKYLGGKEGLFGFFVGEVMKKTKGKANPKVVNEILREKLSKL